MKGKTRESNRSCVDKEGWEAAIYQSFRKLYCGDLLCVQLHRSSWWPAQIVDDGTVSASKRPRKRRAGEVLVRLYGSYNYLYVDPIRACLEFANTLKEYDGSHTAILEKTLKGDLHRLKLDISRKEDLKMKGKEGADSSQDKMVKQKQNLISKSQIMKFHSSVRSSSTELDVKSPNEKSQKRSLGSLSTEENGSRKRKLEDTRKKSKSNGTKSATQEGKCKKDRKMEPENTSSVITSPRRPSTGTTPKNSFKRGNTLLDKPGQGKNKKQEKSSTNKNSRLNSPNSKLSGPEAKAKRGHSSSKRMGSSRSEGQTHNAVQNKSRPSSAHSSEILRTNKADGQKKHPKASKHKTVSTIMVEEAKEPSGRRLKIMRTLGLIAPAGSPFTRNRRMSPTSVLLN